MPRLTYMGGPVSALPDLGVGYRKVMAEELEKAGFQAHYPFQLDLVRTGHLSESEARERWEHALNPELKVLQELINCGRALFLVMPQTVSLGTECEIAFCKWAKIPYEIVYEPTREAFRAGTELLWPPT